jgi:hypothetical protein
MKKHTLIITLLLICNFTFGQETKDSLLINNYEKICEEYRKSAILISVPFNRFNKKMIEKILTKKEKRIIEKSKTNNRLEPVLDSIYDTFSKKEKYKLKLSLMMQPTLIKNSLSKIEKIIEDYGFISQYRLEKLSLKCELPSFSYFGKLSENDKIHISELITKEYDANRMTETNYKEIISLLKK